MNIKGILIDDDKLIHNQLRLFLANFPNVTLLECFENPEQAILYIQQNNNSIDFIFLDIDMPKMTGIEFLNNFKFHHPIVMITSSGDFALDSYSYPNIVDYILKPILLDRIEMSIQKIQKHIKFFQNASIENELIVTDKGKLLKISVNSILYIKANCDYVEIVTKEKKYWMLSTLKKIQEKLPISVFIQCHRSFLINFIEIQSIEDHYATIDKYRIPISRTKKKELKNKFKNKD